MYNVRHKKACFSKAQLFENASLLYTTAVLFIACHNCYLPRATHILLLYLFLISRKIFKILHLFESKNESISSTTTNAYHIITFNPVVSVFCWLATIGQHNHVEALPPTPLVPLSQTYPSSHLVPYSTLPEDFQVFNSAMHREFGWFGNSAGAVPTRAISAQLFRDFVSFIHTTLYYTIILLRHSNLHMCKMYTILFLSNTFIPVYIHAC